MPKTVMILACVAAISFPFRGGDRTSERKSGLAEEHAWGEQTTGERWEGVSEKGEWVGREGIACSQSETFYPTPFAHERGARVQFD